MAASREQLLARKLDILDNEQKQQTGGQLMLNEAEQKVNKLLMGFKKTEIESARQPGGIFPPAHHFFQVKPLIDKSDVFKLIRDMPKGAVLHAHTLAMVDVRWIIQYATYDVNCYMTILPSKQLLLHYFDKPPTDTEHTWQSVTEARSQADDAKAFDDWLYQQLTIIVDDPYTAYPTQDDVWKAFQAIFTTLAGLACNVPFYKDHLYQCMDEFYRDNVQYMEMRAMAPPLSELDGTTHDREWTMATTAEVFKHFAEEHPDYVGTKLILSAHRTRSKEDILDLVKFTISMRDKYPEFLLGFDLVGQEDQGHPLEYYLEELLYPSQLNPPVDLPYFFHAGETTWKDTPVDRNVVDALLLNTRRIGHGFALPKHPQAMQLAQDRGVAIEVNPISNQVLQLVSDLRDHPAVNLLTSGCPLVVSSDGPALWGASGMSYDYYEFFMGIAGAEADLATLKQLFLDSIKYSGMTSTEKQKATAIWEKKWNDFISNTIKTFNL